MIKEDGRHLLEQYATTLCVRMDVVSRSVVPEGVVLGVGLCKVHQIGHIIKIIMVGVKVHAVLEDSRQVLKDDTGIFRGAKGADEGEYVRVGDDALAPGLADLAKAPEAKAERVEGVLAILLVRDKDVQRSLALGAGMITEVGKGARLVHHVAARLLREEAFCTMEELVNLLLGHLMDPHPIEKGQEAFDCSMVVCHPLGLMEGYCPYIGLEGIKQSRP